MTHFIEAQDLEVIYPDGTRAVDGITFSVEEGEVFGFLGPNGAGKSTTIKVITTLLRKTSGVVRIGGLDIDDDPNGIRRIIGVQSQETIVDEDLTGRENLILQGNLHRMGGAGLKARVAELLDLVALSEVADKRASYYSGGMRKRLDLASVLVHRPRVLFLDEPTVGLDPQSRATIWNYLRDLNADEGITIFLTTQYLEEADNLCQRLSIIDNGRLIVTGSPGDLKQQMGGDTVRVKLGPSSDGDPVRERAMNLVGGMKGVTRVLDSDDGLIVNTLNAARLIPELVLEFGNGGIPMVAISARTPTLDDVFLERTGREIRRASRLSNSPRRRRRLSIH